MDNQIETALYCSDSISHTSVTISDFSDEILLNILRFIPSHDLMLNVSQVCRKLQTLCLDKSLRAHVHLHKEYTTNDDAVKQLLKNLSGDIQTLNLSGCYWLAGSTVDQVTRCKALVSLDLSACRLTSVRLSLLLTSLSTLTAIGLVPCCSALHRLHLYLEASEGWREAGGCTQLMVGQSSMPHYQNLHWFSARLAQVCTLLALYLAVFGMRVPEGLTGLVLSVPGPVPPRPVAMMALMESMASTVGNTLSALQLPCTWLDGAILGRVLAHGCPSYLNVSRCSSPGFNPLHALLKESQLPRLWPRTLSPRAVGKVRRRWMQRVSKHLLNVNSRIGVPTYRPTTEVTVGQGEEREDRGLSIQPLLQGCLHLVELELIGAGFSSAMPRNEPAIRKNPTACPWSYNVGDGELAALGGMKFLRKLTLAHLPGVLRGTGLIELVQGCKDLRLLSLANLGSLKTMNYTQALLEALSYCTQLRDLRLEQPYFNANTTFCEALSQCHHLRRLCLVSRHGTFQPAAVAAFMQSCTEVTMCHTFMGGTLTACKTLQKTLLDSFSISRPALSVVIYLLLHEDLTQVIRGMPLCHLDEITLFKSRVTEDGSTVIL
uniref:F-box and leucine-rich repeat protein 18 n=1 Tax=Cyprinus carpio TaxID=7962 RepID=A0A8C1N767_CYPCA